MSCCCCVTPRELADGIREEEQLVGAEENRRQMDVSALRERYRSSREAQRSRAQVLLLRTVSEDGVSVVPVAQGLTSPWEPNSSLDLDPTLDPTFDPWHVHLDLHRRCCPGGTRTDRPSESRDRRLSAGSGSLSSSTESSPCGSFSSSKDDRPTTGPDSDGTRGGLHPDARDGGGGLQQEEHQSHQEEPSRSRKLLSRQQSVGCFPFPSRKTPRISEAARRLGMYSSF